MCQFGFKFSVQLGKESGGFKGYLRVFFGGQEVKKVVNGAVDTILPDLVIVEGRKGTKEDKRHHAEIEWPLTAEEEGYTETQATRHKWYAVHVECINDFDL